MTQQNLINVAVNGADKVAKYLKEEEARKTKAYETALKVEGYRLRRLLQEEIRKSAPGGKRFRQLRYIRRYTGKRLRPDRPLAGLAKMVRYDIQKKPFVMKVGWTGNSVSKSWKRIAEKHQEGFVESVKPVKRRQLTTIGGKLSNRSKIKRYFFIRKETTNFETPERPIIDPFMDKYRQKSRINITRNFRLKMQGKRI